MVSAFCLRKVKRSLHLSALKPYYNKVMEKHKYSKVMDFSLVRQKSIQTLGHRISKSPY